MKTHHDSKVLLYVDKWFFWYKNHFSLSNAHKIISNFFVNFNIFHKKDPCAQKIPKKKKKPFFRFCYSNILKHYYSFEFVIIVQSKVIDLTIM
jgi:hypothetical protein